MNCAFNSVLFSLDRTVWSVEEKKLVETEFAELLKNKKLPSMENCRAVITAHPELINRKPETLKAFINNLNKKSLKEIM